VTNDAVLKHRFWMAMELFSRNPFHQKLRTHKLSGKLEGLWAFTVSYDCRVVFKFLNGEEVLLVDIGGHDEVY
jgi:toxin HigB-1